MKRLQVIGLLDEDIELIKSWLNNRFFYITIDGRNLNFYDLLLGTVQGSILGQVLYAIFVSLMFKIAALELFANDSFITRSNESIIVLLKDTEKTLEVIT
jgi:hypothetical protein